MTDKVIACWSYDDFGNRLSQAVSTVACTSNPTPTTWAHYNSNNQITGTPQAPGGLTYDSSGDVTNDGTNEYLYDAEGRICAVYSNPIGGISSLTGYLYDADGTRVAKGSITAWSCDPTQNGFQTTTDFVLGLGGEQVTEMAVNVTVSGPTVTNTLVWQHTNVFAGGKLLGTYDKDGLHFYFDDPLGTRSAQTNFAGALEETCTSLPYGDALNCLAPGESTYLVSINTPTEQHFTGKERDTESGNDYFGARYYSSNMGRFMSPDWSAKVEPVPYAKLGDPQTLNLYAYDGNNPISVIDADGHDGDGQQASGSQAAPSSGSASDKTTSPSSSGHSTDKPIAWSSLSGAQQGIVSGGEKSWNAMNAKSRDNFADITNAIGQIKLSNGTTGLSEVKSASMRENGREMNVVWKADAAEVFKSTGQFSDTKHLPTHPGAEVMRKGVGGLGKGLKLIFPTQDNPEIQAHIDDNLLYGLTPGHRHFDTDNDDVTQHKDVYKKFCGSLPGLIP